MYVWRMWYIWYILVSICTCMFEYMVYVMYILIGVCTCMCLWYMLYILLVSIHVRVCVAYVMYIFISMCTCMCVNVWYTWCIFLLVYAHTCMYVVYVIYTHWCVHVYLCTLKVDLGIFLLSIFIFLRQALSVNLKLTDLARWADQWTSESPVSILHNIGLCHYAQPSHGLWGP